MTFVYPWVLRGSRRFVVGLCLVCGGCGAGLNPAVPESAAVRERPREVVADWDDVEAAAWAAAPRVEMTIANVERPDAWTQVVELVSSRDEVCVLTVRREPVPPGTPRGSPLERGEGVPLRVEFRVGRFGDAAREWAFLTDWVDRMEDLRGVGAAPIRWDAR